MKGTVDGPFQYDEVGRFVFSSKSEMMEERAGESMFVCVFLQTTQQIRYEKMNTCLTADESIASSTLSLKTCDREDQRQKWRFREIFTD